MPEDLQRARLRGLLRVEAVLGQVVAGQPQHVGCAAAPSKLWCQIWPGASTPNSASPGTRQSAHEHGAPPRAARDAGRRDTSSGLRKRRAQRAQRAREPAAEKNLRSI